MAFCQKLEKEGKDSRSNGKYIIPTVLGIPESLSFGTSIPKIYGILYKSSWYNKGRKMTCDTNRVIAGLFVQQAGNRSIPHRLICSMYVQKEVDRV